MCPSPGRFDSALLVKLVYADTAAATVLPIFLFLTELLILSIDSAFKLEKQQRLGNALCMRCIHGYPCESSVITRAIHFVR